MYFCSNLVVPCNLSKTAPIYYFGSESSRTTYWEDLLPGPFIGAASETRAIQILHPSFPDEVADEECCADGDEDDGQVDLAARVGRLRARAGQAGSPDAAATRKKALDPFLNKKHLSQAHLTEISWLRELTSC